MAAFLAPLIVTFPFSGLPPVTTYLSNETRPNRCVMFQLEHSIYHLSEKHNLRDNNTLTEKSQSLTKIYSQHCEKLQRI